LKREIKERLLEVGLEATEAAAESELIARDVSGLSVAQQILFEGTLKSEWNERVEHILSERKRRVPLQYILGHTSFMGLQFRVEPGVFIPRADTESLVESTIETVRKERLLQPFIMDIGTGSGAISVALAVKMPHAKILAVELEETPFRVAQENARLNGVFERIKFVRGNWREHVPLDLDIIVSNPPYIAPALKPTLAPEVLDFEPHSALFGSDEDGVGYYRELARITRFAFNKIAGGWLLCEIGDDQAIRCETIFRDQGWTKIGICHDLNGAERVLMAHS
jgi:release factor glutamine methyltransferase